MKFSISLPTGFEGVMYPIPFVEPGDFVRMAQLCEKLGYDSVWGNDHITSQHYVRELFPDKAPNFYEVLVTLAPWYRVFPTPVTLLVAQAVLFAVSAYVVGRYAVDRGQPHVGPAGQKDNARSPRPALSGG